MSQLSEIIDNIRRRRGGDLAILGHHYQSDAVLKHTDHQGDSLELARLGRGLEARHIVFCGVFFMAESSAVLAAPGQKVHTPAREAKCVMSDMAPASVVSRVLGDLNAGGKRVVPLTYVNSSAAVKAACARYGGSVCTSANADRMLEWALRQGDAVLFLPDMNLGLNTADKLNLASGERRILDVRGGGSAACATGIPDERLLLWPGRCVIHHRFKPEQISEARSRHPGARIVVHPECAPQEVALADAAGSTSFIIRYVAEASEGSTILIGTETNLVWRLADRWKGRRTVLPLRNSLCANMAKVTLAGLAGLLERLDEVAPVRVEAEVAEGARLALERMLEVCS